MLCAEQISALRQVERKASKSALRSKYCKLSLAVESRVGSDVPDGQIVGVGDRGPGRPAPPVRTRPFQEHIGAGGWRIIDDSAVDQRRIVPARRHTFVGRPDDLAGIRQLFNPVGAPADNPRHGEQWREQFLRNVEQSVE